MTLVNEHLTRQSDIIDSTLLSITKINIIGAGAIGSWTALALAKMGITNIEVWDFDTVDIVNMNCQFFPYNAIGKSKVEALRDQVKEYTNVDIVIHNEKYEGQLLEGIVISALDNMEVRKMIWDKNMFNPMVVKFIDPRMAAEFCAVYVADGSDRWYENTLYTDDQAVAERCTAKSTIYTASLVSGLVCKAVKDIVMDKPYSKCTQWDIANNKIINY